MGRIHSIPALTLAAFVAAVAHGAAAAGPATGTPLIQPDAVALPAPRLDGRISLERALGERRSVREFAHGPLTLAEVGQLAWAAHGITGAGGKRTTPSARAVYPLTVYLAAREVRGLGPGVYRYEPRGHVLVAVAPGSRAAALSAATRRMAAVATAPLVVVVAGDSALAAQKFGPRAERWTAMETGFVVQDVYLEATALGLGTVMVGGYDDALLRRAIDLPAGQVPYALMPVGRRK